MSDSMRRFNWRLFRRKGMSKERSKEEKLLSKNVDDIKEEVKTRGGGQDLRQVAKELLPEED